MTLGELRTFIEGLPDDLKLEYLQVPVTQAVLIEREAEGKSCIQSVGFYPRDVGAMSYTWYPEGTLEGGRSHFRVLKKIGRFGW